MIEIVPAIIASSYSELEEKIKLIQPHVSRVHIDIMDGEFVSQRTLEDPMDFERLDTELELEVHLMVQKPENKIVSWLNTRVEKFLVHWESTQKFQEVVDLVQESEKQIFAVLNPETDFKVLDPFADIISGVQCMTVHPGQYGADFLPEVIKKIEDLHYFYPDLPIQVDGGITPKTIASCAKAGSSVFTVGSYIFKSKNPAEAIKKMQSSL